MLLLWRVGLRCDKGNGEQKRSEDRHVRELQNSALSLVCLMDFEARMDTGFAKSCAGLFLRESRNNLQEELFREDMTGGIKAARTKPQCKRPEGPTDFGPKLEEL